MRLTALAGILVTVAACGGGPAVDTSYPGQWKVTSSHCSNLTGYCDPNATYNISDPIGNGYLVTGYTDKCIWSFAEQAGALVIKPGQSCTDSFGDLYEPKSWTINMQPDGMIQSSEYVLTTYGGATSGDTFGDTWIRN